MQDLRASSVSIQPVIGCSRESEQESDWVEGGWAWREITCWSHKSRENGLPLGSTADFHVDTARSGTLITKAVFGQYSYPEI